MAKEEQKSVNETVLVAWVRVHLISGDAFELLPFEDTSDVKAKVNDLLADWVKSGFLIRGSEILPWHQVQRVEALQVEELSPDQSALRRKEWEARETARLQQSFWRTKKQRENKDEKGGEEKQG